MGEYTRCNVCGGSVRTGQRCRCGCEDRMLEEYKICPSCKDSFCPETDGYTMGGIEEDIMFCCEVCKDDYHQIHCFVCDEPLEECELKHGVHDYCFDHQVEKAEKKLSSASDEVIKNTLVKISCDPFLKTVYAEVLLRRTKGGENGTVT